MINDTLAIYVNSYDGSSDLWDTFFKIYDKYWSECPYHIYLVNNEKIYIHKNVKVINTGSEVDWFHRAIKSLDSIDSKYILFMLEDYFISKVYKQDEIDSILNFIKTNKIFYYQLSPKFLKKEDILPVHEHDEYPISLQPAIWHRETLLSILKNINGKSPWDFEFYYNDLYDKTSSKAIPGAYYDNRDILGYKNGVLRGKWIPATIRFFKKNGIDIYTGEREVLSRYEECKFYLAQYGSVFLDYRLKKIIKIIFKKIRFNYV